ncbi:MAG: MBL fold metallo-hydrolase [Aquisalinus sp.]|nr:MBL fold metallo-hydrolase [Aquisalinus sp.]
MSIPFIKSFDFEYGRADRLSPTIRRVICNNPGPFTFTGTGTYLLGQNSIAVIDPGPANDDHLAALLAAAGNGKITHIVVTHTHKDHCGGVAALKEATGASVYGSRAHPENDGMNAPALDEGADLTYRPDEVLADGDVLDTDEWHLETLATPGHISNHLCFALPAERVLFTGDHIMGWATTVVAAPDGNMTDYYNSLDLLLERNDEIYYPTHGAPVSDPQNFVRAVKEHREMRDAQVLTQLKAGHTRIMDMVAEMYKDVDKSLHIAAALNVQAHLERHVSAGRVTQEGESLLNAEYRLMESDHPSTSS